MNDLIVDDLCNLLPADNTHGERINAVDRDILRRPDGLPRNITGWGPPGARSEVKRGFRLEGLLPGKLMLFGRLDEKSEVYSEIEVREISDSDIHEVELKVRQGGSISGVIVIEGSSDPAVLSKISELQLNSVMMNKEPGPPGIWQTKANTDGGFASKAYARVKYVSRCQKIRHHAVFRFCASSGVEH